ncbi:MAG: peptide-methionine (S)-S-oxide reductase [Bacillariaceae sp.]|jgi:peptide-methionine (S)-S-oxide reductase
MGGRRFIIIIICHVNMMSLLLILQPLMLLLPSVNALAVQRPRPKFYSDIISPLAQIASYHACLGEQVPSALDMDMNIKQIPEYKALAAHIIFNSNKQQKQKQEQPEDDCSQTTIKTRQEVVTTATFAGGCFWGIQLAFDREPGVLATCVGYTQGNNDSTFPTYSEVCSEETGHTEACLVVYDPIVVSYSRLAELMFDFIPDPTMLNRVGKDRGTQYRTGLYGHSNEQYKLAQIAFDRENRMWFGREVMTEVKNATIFWPAEEDHQCYLEKGGRYGRSQMSDKSCTDEIRCYG